MKHQNTIPAKLVLHIYSQTNTHMNIPIGQLISGSFLSGMQSYEYSTTPKGEQKYTCILQKGDIRFDRKRPEFSHNSGILHLANKVSTTFHTQKNSVKKATVKQWRTTTTLRPVRIRAEIIIRLDSYPRIMNDTPVSTVWLEHQKTEITYQITTK